MTIQRSIFKDENALLTHGIDLHHTRNQCGIVNLSSCSPESLYSYERMLHSKYNLQSCEESIAVIILVNTRIDIGGL